VPTESHCGATSQSNLCCFSHCKCKLDSITLTLKLFFTSVFRSQRITSLLKKKKKENQMPSVEYGEINISDNIIDNDTTVGQANHESTFNTGNIFRQKVVSGFYLHWCWKCTVCEFWLPIGKFISILCISYNTYHPQRTNARIHLPADISKLTYITIIIIHFVCFFRITFSSLCWQLFASRDKIVYSRLTIDIANQKGICQTTRIF